MSATDDPLTCPLAFCRYIEGAAMDGVLISGAHLNRLARMDPKGPGAPFPPGGWYEVALEGVMPAIRRIRAAIAPPPGQDARDE